METRIVINEIDTTTEVSLSSFDVGNEIVIQSYDNGGTAISPVISVNGKIGLVVLNKNDIGLGNVDNTSDLNKPISLATLSALNLLQTQINNLGSNNLTILQATSSNWNSVYSSVNSLSSNWNNVYNNVRSLSSNWSSASAAAINYTHTNFLPLTGGTISGETRFNNKVTIFGDLSCTGVQSFANTIFSTTTSLSVVHVGSGPALWVGNNGDGDIASFYDIDQGVEILHVGGNSGSFPNVGIKTSTPNKALTVNGEISSNNAIYDATGNSTQWNTAYNVATIVQSTSSSWEESADIDLYKTSVATATGTLVKNTDFDLYKGSVASLSGNWNSVYSTVSSISGNIVTIPSVTNYLSTNKISISSIEVTDRVELDNQLYHVADEDGQWIGNIRLRENNTRLINRAKNWKIVDQGAARGVTVSSEGRIQIILTNARIPILSNNYGKTWINSNIPVADWVDVSMSADGKHRSVVGISTFIYVSNDYGITWNNKGVSRNWNKISISSDGKYQTAVASNDKIWISSDYGNNWIDKGTSQNWSSVSINTTGKLQTAVVNGGQIWISNDYGNNWNPKEINRNWQDIALSSDGRYQVAVNQQFNNPNTGVYISNDYGNNWIFKYPTSVIDYPKNVAISSDGKYISVIDSNGKMHSSSSHGNGTWEVTPSAVFGPTMGSVAMSSDGKYQLIAGYWSYLSVADEEIDGELNVIGSVNYTQPYARFGIFSITGNDLPNLSNSTEHIIPWNTEEEPFSDIIETQLTNDNVVIKRNGTYHVKVRFSCFDMNDASDYLRIRLRQSTSPITNAAAGDFVTTLAWRFAGGGLAFAGEMYVEGETILRLTPETTGTVYLAATVLGSGGSGSVGTTFKPFINNSQGTQPFMEVRKVA